MIVEVDTSAAVPAYEQIRAQIARMVAAGVLVPGARLPTIRQLAADLGLAKGTVAKAYEALLREGVVEAAGRRGTVVSARGADRTGIDAAAALAEAARDFAVTARQLSADPATALAAVTEAMATLPGTAPERVERDAGG